MARSRELAFIKEQRQKQVSALLSAFAHASLPQGITKTAMRNALELVWDSGFNTGVREIRGEVDDINQEQRMQGLAAMESLGLERPVDAEIIIHVWRVGLLTARDLRGVSTHEHPTRSKLTTVKIDKDG